MKTKTGQKFKEMPLDYAGLVMMFMPKAVHDEVDYDNTMEVIDQLVGHELTDDQEIYLDTLSTLVGVYEDEHHDIESRHLSPLRALKYIMEQNGMTASELGHLLGDRTLGSKILRGERKIGVTYARILAKKFHLDIGVFLD